jgi:RND family efflux transporter MFP subunit
MNPNMSPFMSPRTSRTLVAALLPLAAACSPSPEPVSERKAPAVAVTVAQVRDARTAPPVIATGTFASRDEIPLAFKIGGIVQRVVVDEGQTVHRGQILAALDLREIDAAVSKAQVGADKAQRDFARVQRLAADSVATLAQLQDATSALDAAKADLATATVNREYALITAPEEGIVLARTVNAGSTVGPGTPVLTLGGSRRGRVLRIGLPDRDALRVALGDKATVRFDAVGAREFTGTVVLVGRSADPRTGTYTVEIALAGTDALPSGLVGQARIAVKGSAKGHTVPVDALLEADRDSATVYTIPASGDLIATPQRVRVAQLTGDQARIESLPTDTRVIARGASYVTPGALVRIISDATLDSAASTTASRTAAPRGGKAP